MRVTSWAVYIIVLKKYWGKWETINIFPELTFKVSATCWPTEHFDYKWSITGSGQIKSWIYPTQTLNQAAANPFDCKLFEDVKKLLSEGERICPIQFTLSFLIKVQGEKRTVCQHVISTRPHRANWCPRLPPIKKVSLYGSMSSVTLGNLSPPRPPATPSPRSAVCAPVAGCLPYVKERLIKLS